MSSVEFAQYALRERLSPPSVGSVKARLRHATHKLGWSANRVKDVWYADPRISISADEIREIEELIGRADVLLMGSDADFHRPFLAALRAVARLADRTRAER